VQKFTQKYEWITAEIVLAQWELAILHRKLWEIFTVVDLKLGQNFKNELGALGCVKGASEHCCPLSGKEALALSAHCALKMAGLSR
jgi:hypothetical protein